MPTGFRRARRESVLLSQIAEELDKLRDSGAGREELTARLLASYEKAGKENFLKIMAERKGELLKELVAKRSPGRILEIGSYMGHSALTMLSALPDNLECKVFCLEVDPLACAYVTVASELAGREDQVVTLPGRSSELIPGLNKLDPKPFDIVFLDHRGTIYHTDLISLEELGLVSEGTVIIADNCLSPGAPEFLELVCSNPRYETRIYEVPEAFQNTKDWVCVATVLGSVKTNVCSTRIQSSEMTRAALLGRYVDSLSFKSSSGEEDIEWAKHTEYMFKALSSYHHLVQIY